MPDRIKQFKSGKFSVPKNRHYEVMLANCHPKGRHIHVTGQVVFDVMDGDATNLTTESLTILVSVAFFVFLFLTILSIRINWGTRADYEYGRFGLVSIAEEEEDEQEQDEELSQTYDNDSMYNDEDDQEDDDAESGGHSLLLRVEQATIV